ncbi:MAG: hypothetical protein ACOQNY_00600 [Mycoplasmoidaceae bacterium]
MIRQNIKIALLAFLALITFWLVMFNFIKIDIATKGVITFVDSFNYLALDVTSSAYIENHQLDYVKMQYAKQYFNCHITYSSTSEDFNYYLISLPPIVDKTKSYIQANIIIDSLNIYEYILKK